MHEGQLRLEKIGENHIKHVVRGLCKGSKRISIIGSIYVATILRALKLGLDAVARRLWCVCAINSEFFLFFSTSDFVLFKLEFVFLPRDTWYKTFHKAKCEWYSPP